MNPILELEKTIYLMNQLEDMPLPQVAMAGRSNVGKSSLVNALAGRKSLAKISSTPGKTRSLNFYRVVPDNFYLVDLPGYGYARCSKTERDKWARLIEAYLTKNEWLKAVAVLLDSRLPPQKIDMELVSYLQALRIPMIPIMTKSDKVKQKDCAQRQRQWKNIIGDNTKILVSSSKTGSGLNKIWATIRDASGLELPEDA
ncbi:ribosome biogenesis GTP-binding protein YihA/YsxC [Desulfobaculum bizertense]|uniref:Probable GTP-binding protein EngB n=1 Tax=Desulfobaculum bizertense DSM 18034 TaxID=1121442 RepID=A0A1T4W1Y4_9BACT|nr:ribosome biogenesis GTP-binding protein YihA/YsxC [Desulfobaculum bizertense]UIJ38876.1 ribosome biogenesis GTP-binding protein YihA/YsxC [Desulfobaculum bizertense]SKA71262.1 GTP-binding protein [Desulfobaculum bizertense DSM 18034]